MYNWAKIIELIELGIFCAFSFFFIIQIFYILRYYYPAAFKNTRGRTSNTPPLSVIICAKNEAENLKNNLRFVLNQNYPSYEVIVVNDCSTDNTDEVLGELIKEFPILRITSIPLDRKFSHGKKLALTVGIKSAKNEDLVFTDADCRPDSENWLMEFSEGFRKHNIVLGYGGYSRQKSILNNFIRHETLNIALQYIGSALAGNPYMGVGRNMGYKKSLFFENIGFASHYGMLSGDDDLFINEVANKTNTTVVVSKNSFTRSHPETKWRDFLTQKIRHLSTSDFYKKKHVFMLGLEPISRAWFYFLFVLVLFIPFFFRTAIAMVAFRGILQIILYFRASKRFGEKNLWLTCIIFDLFSLFFNFVAYFSLSIRSRRIKWK